MDTKLLDKAFWSDVIDMAVREVERPQLTLAPWFSRGVLLIIEKAARERLADPDHATDFPAEGTPLRFRTLAIRLQHELFDNPHAEGRSWRRSTPKELATSKHNARQALYEGVFKRDIWDPWTQGCPRTCEPIDFFRGKEAYEEVFALDALPLRSGHLFRILKRAHTRGYISTPMYQYLSNQAAWQTIVRNAWILWHRKAIKTRFHRKEHRPPRPWREDLIALLQVNDRLVPPHHQELLFQQMTAPSADPDLRAHAELHLVLRDGRRQWAKRRKGKLVVSFQ